MPLHEKVSRPGTYSGNNYLRELIAYMVSLNGENKPTIHNQKRKNGKIDIEAIKASPRSGHRARSRRQRRRHT